MGLFKAFPGRLQGFLDKLTNDAHVPIALFVFIVTFAYCAHTGKDIPPGFVSSLYAFYAFLGGHAAVYQKWPDAPPAAPTVDVQVDNTNTNANSNTTTATATAGAGTAGDKG
jgi:hypothetical protein